MSPRWMIESKKSERFLNAVGMSDNCDAWKEFTPGCEDASWVRPLAPFSRANSRL